MGYWSWTLSTADQKCDTTSRSCLLCYGTFSSWDLTCKGKITIGPDHVVLKWILNLADLTNRLVKWRLRLFQLECIEIHRVGSNVRPKTHYSNSKKKKRQDISSGQYPCVSSWATPAPTPHNDEQEESSTDIYCVSENCNIKIGELPSTLAKIVTIFLAKCTDIVAGKAPTFGEFLNDQAGE